MGGRGRLAHQVVLRLEALPSRALAHALLLTINTVDGLGVLVGDADLDRGLFYCFTLVVN